MKILHNSLCLFFACVIATISVFPVSASNTDGNCPDPTGLVVISADISSATLGWDNIPGATRYGIEVENTNNNPVLFHVEQIVNNANQYIVTGLQPNGFYKFKVRTYCANGDKSDWTAWSSFNSSNGAGSGNNGACAIPGNLNVITANNAVTVTWGAVAGATAYRIEVEHGIGNSNAFFYTNSFTANSATIPGLLAGLTYKVKVRTICGAGQSAWSDWMFFNSSAGGGNNGGGNVSCPVPASLAVSNITNASALISWDAVSGALSYTLEAEQVQGPDLPEQVVSTNSFQLNNLLPGKAYKFKVRSNCGIKHSDWSAWFIFTTATSIYTPSGGSSNKMAAPQMNLNIAPNPVVQGSNITLSYFGPAEQPVTICLLDISGKPVYQNSIFSPDGRVEDSVNIGALPKGFYFVRAQSGGASTTVKLLVTE